MTALARIPHFAGIERGFELREFPIPDVEAGGVLIKLSATSICGTDIHMWKGELPTRHGGFIGHEMTGTIFHLGSEVATDGSGQPVQEGDRIVFSNSFPCRTCECCLRGDLFACPCRPGYDDFMEEKYLPFHGGFGEYRYLGPGHWMFKVPDDLDDYLVATINCAASTVTHGLAQAHLRAGESVIVQGAGGLGLHAIACAKDKGANNIIVIDQFSARLQLAKRMGADVVIGFDEYPLSSDRIKVARELAGGFGANVVIDCVGTVAGMEEGIRMLAPVGRYVEVGNTIPSHTVSLPVSRLVNERVTLYLTGGYDPMTLVEVMAFLLRTKEIYPFDELVTKVFPMTQINEAFQFADWQAADSTRPPVGRVLVIPD